MKLLTLILGLDSCEDPPATSRIIVEQLDRIGSSWIELPSRIGSEFGFWPTAEVRTALIIDMRSDIEHDIRKYDDTLCALVQRFRCAMVVHANDHTIDVVLRRILPQIALCSDPGAPEVLHDASQFIFEHLSDPQLSVTRIAKHFLISADTLEQLFRSHEGNSVWAYVRDLRYHESKRLLLETNLKIKEVGQMVGYPNLTSFTRFFRQYERQSPRQFKAQMSLYPTQCAPVISASSSQPAL